MSFSADAVYLTSAMCIYLHMERDSRRIVKRLLAEGWREIAVRGSHHKFGRDSAIVIVPHPKRDLPIGTARAIAKAAGWL